MIEVIKNKIWNLLKEKDISLAMLYDKSGRIVWSKGRRIVGKTVHEGEGFSKTYVNKSLETSAAVQTGIDVFSSRDNARSSSIMELGIKSLLILPVADTYFLYVDSGTRDTFNQSDNDAFRILGELLGDTINMIRKNESDTGGIAGSSPKTQMLRSRAAEYSLIDEPILIRGETGTGKNHIAELIHIYSGRPGKFKVIHTPGIPENLFESEMFGHTKGAFTDAGSAKPGLIQEAENGTLYIDEITEVPITIQAKLLRFVETRKYTVLGETGEKIANVRIMASTNKDISQAIRDKEFREDLYYRLNVLEIQIPPLRERKEDLHDLVHEKINFLKGKHIGKGFWEALKEHDWPGNVRELISVIKRAGLVHKDTVDGRDIKSIIAMSRRDAGKPSQDDKLDAIWNKLLSGISFWDAVKKPYLDRELNRAEVMEILKRGLMETNGQYKALMTPFNLEKKEYKNFMRFLYDNRLK